MSLVVYELSGFIVSFCVGSFGISERMFLFFHLPEPLLHQRKALPVRWHLLSVYCSLEGHGKAVRAAGPAGEARDPLPALLVMSLRHFANSRDSCATFRHFSALTAPKKSHHFALIAHNHAATVSDCPKTSHVRQSELRSLFIGSGLGPTSNVDIVSSLA